MTHRLFPRVHFVPSKPMEGFENGRGNVFGAATE